MKYTWILVVVLFSSCATPLAKFSMDNAAKEAPADVMFKNESSNADSYLWDFGDGKTSTKESPNHTFSQSGRYTISLEATKGNKSNKALQEIFFEAPSDCVFRMTTTMGAMTFQLSDDTPEHRDNFLKLIKENYYDGLLFHRIIEGFMAQGGDPTSKTSRAGQSLGTGGPGYTVTAEFSPKMAHVKGALAAARTGGPSNPEKRSSGSQFYIVHGKATSPELLEKMESQKSMIYPDDVKEQYTKLGGTPFLDQDYTVFGMMIEGFDVLDKIAAVATDQRDRPTDDVKIISVELIK